MEENILLKEEKDGVILLTLNRPAVMNSLSFDLLRALQKEVEAIRFMPGCPCCHYYRRGRKSVLLRRGLEGKGHHEPSPGQGIHSDHSKSVYRH